MELVTCPHCSARVRADRIERHVARVHSPDQPTTDGPKKAKPTRKKGWTRVPTLPGAVEGSSLRDWDFD